jgi:D-alanyl-D-alanine carboxypeptidase/D-alanyl-D-alanine-endopeptidase (penicillin-binding protein 4)
MRHTAAAGRCQGKTGTLTGVSNLVGYCQSAGGHLLAFAIFTDGIEIPAAHTFQDHMAITLADSKIGGNGEAARAGSARFAPGLRR